MPDVRLKHLNPTTMPSPNGYSQVVIVPAGVPLAYVSGQVGMHPDGMLAASTFAEQATQAFENVKASLEAVGSSFEHVIRLNMFVTDFASQLEELRAIRDRYVTVAAPPASTTVQVSRLFAESILFELEVVAVVPHEPLISNAPVVGADA